MDTLVLPPFQIKLLNLFRYREIYKHILVLEKVEQLFCKMERVLLLLVIE
jgi:hypothetical protein